MQRKLNLSSAKAKSISKEISSLKNKGEFKAFLEDEIFQEYESILQSINGFDLDDLLIWPLRIFKEYPQVLKDIQTQFSWILVDEYQDINKIQYELIRLLASKSNANLFVVGDPHQAIYGFRGANIQYIQQFASI